MEKVKAQELISKKKKKFRGSSLKWVTFGYVVFILLGSLLLCSPLASKEKVWTSFVDSLFTATSATCVTGLVVFDTYSYWNLFGQIVILFLIQLGGIGYMTVITIMTRSLGLRISFKDRKFLMESVGVNDRASFSTIVQNIVFGSIIVELIGAAVLSIRFIPEFGVWNGIYFSIFHSVSAFCNAGFDLMGIKGTPFASLTSYASDPLVCITLIMLIFIGGIGFIVWGDVIRSKGRFSVMKLHSKITLIGSAVLIILSTFMFYGYEAGHMFKDMSFGQGLLRAFFQAVTTRTAGFNTIDLSQISNGSTLLTIFLMFIGGAPGSTAGGMKITTFIVIILGILSLSSNSGGDVVIGDKKISKDVLHNALAILASYLLAVFIACFAIVAIESFSTVDVAFETVSAIGTVGLTRGVTSSLHWVSKLILVMLMYIGRVGILIIVLSFSRPNKSHTIIIPEENIMVG